MILVIGGTGTTGSALLRRLAELGVPARALVRPRPPSSLRLAPTPPPVPGIDYVTGDAAVPASLRAALAGVRQVFVAMGNGPDQKQTELGILDAAVAAGVEHLVKVSAPVVAADAPVAVARLHHAVEQAVIASGVGYTFLRPYAFMQNLLRLAPVIRHTGTFAATTGRAPLNMVDARDIADVAAVVLTRPETRGRAHVLTGPEAVSHPEVARRITALGRPTRYLDRTPARLRLDMEHDGLPPWLVDHVLEIQALALTHPETPNTTVAELTGHAPRNLDAFLREHAAAFLPAAQSATPRPADADGRAARIAVPPPEAGPVPG